jgi:hypothetical protein
MASERTPEEKAAVLAALMSGQSVSAAAREFHVSRPTVRRWRLEAGISDVLPVVNQKKREELGVLVADLLRTILTTLRIQAEQCSDPAWIKLQPASELAVFFGVLADKGFRILEAIDTGTDNSQ